MYNLSFWLHTTIQAYTSMYLAYVPCLIVVIIVLFTNATFLNNAVAIISETGIRRTGISFMLAIDATKSGYTLASHIVGYSELLGNKLDG